MPLAKTTRTADDYWALPEGVSAELIDGDLWDLAAPSREHQEIAAELVTDLRLFIREHGGGCKAYQSPFAVNLFADDTTFVEPDVLAVCDRDKLSARGCEGAPDFVVEVVSPSSTGMDYVTKLSLYHEAGVREYWICDPMRRRTHVYRFDVGDDAPAIYPFGTPVPSGTFEGFSIRFADVVADL